MVGVVLAWSVSSCSSWTSRTSDMCVPSHVTRNALGPKLAVWIGLDWIGLDWIVVTVNRMEAVPIVCPPHLTAFAVNMFLPKTLLLTLNLPLPVLVGTTCSICAMLHDSDDIILTRIPVLLLMPATVQKKSHIHNKI